MRKIDNSEKPLQTERLGNQDFEYETASTYTDPLDLVDEIDLLSEAHFNVRYRVDGMLRTVRELSTSESKSVINSIKAVSGMDIAERRRPQDGVFIG